LSLFVYAIGIFTPKYHWTAFTVCPAHAANYRLSF